MKYFYKKHGLLFIVYCKVDTGFQIVDVEDSRWEDETKAKEHCYILNVEFLEHGINRYDLR